MILFIRAYDITNKIGKERIFDDKKKISFSMVSLFSNEKINEC